MLRILGELRLVSLWADASDSRSLSHVLRLKQRSLAAAEKPSLAMAFPSPATHVSIMSRLFSDVPLGLSLLRCKIFKLPLSTPNGNCGQIHFH